MPRLAEGLIRDFSGRPGAGGGGGGSVNPYGQFSKLGVPFGVPFSEGAVLLLGPKKGTLS